MKPPAPPAEYQPPVHVGVLQLLSLLGFVSALFWIATSGLETDPLAFGIGALVGAMYLWIFACVAGNAARAAWQSARLAHQLQPVIDEINRAADEREQRERAARLAQEAEIRRVVEARQGRQGE